MRHFGVLISAVHKLKDEEHKLKHFVVYEEMKEYGTNVLQRAFQYFLELTTNAPIIHKFEERVVNLSLQVLF